MPMTTTTDTPRDLRCALAAQRAGRLREAEALYRRVLATEPDDAHAMHLLGTLCQQRGQDEEALRLPRRAVELDSSAPPASTPTSAPCWGSWARPCASWGGRRSPAVPAPRDATRRRFGLR